MFLCSFKRIHSQDPLSGEWPFLPVLMTVRGPCLKLSAPFMIVPLCAILISIGQKGQY